MAFKLRGFLPLVAALMTMMAALVPEGASARTAVSASRLGIHPEGVTRFVMDLSDDMPFTVSTQADPMRVVIETNVAWQSLSAPTKAVGAVAQLKHDPAGRIVLTLKEPALVKSAFVIAPRDGMGWRFVMDLKETTKAAFLASVKGAPAPASAKMAEAPAPRPSAPPAPVAAPAPTPAPAPEPVPVVVSTASAPIVVLSPAAQAAAAPAPRAVKTGAVLSAAMPPPPPRPEPAALSNAPTSNAPMVALDPAPVAMPSVTKVSAALPVPPPEPKAEPRADKGGDGRPVVVIDPGHGGVDPGAIGVSGAYEKHITLAVARALKDQLEKSGRYRAVLTRDRDVFIRLRDRVSLARQHNADLFISLHADAVKNPSIRGLSVYTLSQNASDSEAEQLAEKENKADLIAGIDLSHESADVANILIDLAQRETMNRSAQFAGGIVEQLGRETTLLGNTHRFAGFAVLKAPDIPSVLIELGYLSNQLEERDLRQEEYRDKLARALSRSVDAFFLQGQKARRL